MSVVSPLRHHTLPLYDFEAVVTDGHTSLATNLTIHVAPVPHSTARRNVVVSFSVPVSTGQYFCLCDVCAHILCETNYNIFHVFISQENLSGGVVGDLIAALRAAGARLAPDPQFELVCALVFDL